MGMHTCCELRQCIVAGSLAATSQQPSPCKCNIDICLFEQICLIARLFALGALAGNATVKRFLLQMMVDELNKVVQRRAGQAETGAPSTNSPKERKRKRDDEA